MKLSKKILNQIDSHRVSVPSSHYFELPEKVLQFGTGVLLRGLPDYFIDKANKQAVFNGRIVVVKSTSTPGADFFDLQDGLFTQCIRGIEHGKMVDEYCINASISRVLTAATQWKSILELAANFEMQVVISNTTESGLVLVKEDSIRDVVPASFPGKLLAFLYKRWQVFGGASSAGMIILPTELIPDNGKVLKKIVNQLAELNKLELVFIDWLNNANHFCNTLVDRIVPGKLSPSMTDEANLLLGYEDDLMIMSEPFCLWAIETSNNSVKEKLSFAASDPGVIIAPSIERFRELKLRLLNGSHSFSCALAILAGFKTVKEAMCDAAFVAYLNQLMKKEIAICLVNEDIHLEEALAFATSVQERFANPSIDHKWMSISVNYTEKMRLRTVALINQYYQKEHKAPTYMSIGFAAYLMLMRSVSLQDGKYFGQYKDIHYAIDDTKAQLFAAKLKHQTLEAYVHDVLSDVDLWGVDFSTFILFEHHIIHFMNEMEAQGIMQFLMNHSKQELV